MHAGQIGGIVRATFFFTTSVHITGLAVVNWGSVTWRKKGEKTNVDANHCAALFSKQWAYG